MADEFNLVPTNNLEKHLDNILRTASGGEPQYDLAPNWRTEQYLAAIASALASGGGGGGGGALVVNVTNEEVGPDSYAFVADKSMSEVLSAIASGNPVLCKYNALISFFTKEEDYPEVFTNLSAIEQGLDEQGHDGLYVRMYWFEYAEDGTFSGLKSEAFISI